METPDPDRHDFNRAILETFLGGMETPVHASCPVVPDGLETFLGGMETEEGRHGPEA